MKQLTCEMCGGNEILKQDGVFVCQSCGTKYTVEEAKKMMVEIDGPVEVKGTVKVDNSQNITNMSKMADDAFNGGNFQQAYNLYQSILQNDYENAHATFMLGLSSAYLSTLANLNVNELVQSIKKSFKIMEANVAEEDYHQFVFSVLQLTNTFCCSFHDLAVKHRNKYQSLKSTAEDFWEHTRKLLFCLENLLLLLPEKFLANGENEPVIWRVIRSAQQCIDDINATLQYVNGTKVVGRGLYGGEILGDNWVEINASYEIIKYAESAENRIKAIKNKLPSVINQKNKENKAKKAREEFLKNNPAIKNYLEKKIKDAESELNKNENRHTAAFALLNSIVALGLLIFFIIYTPLWWWSPDSSDMVSFFLTFICLVSTSILSVHFWKRLNDENKLNTENRSLLLKYQPMYQNPIEYEEAIRKEMSKENSGEV